MDGCRDQGGVFNQGVSRTRSNTYKKPPLGGSSNWQQSIPSWEKKFCASIGSVPWRKLVETKKVIHLYDNVIKWNDSAGKEAFQNAKSKFYANMHGLPCDKHTPDPDIYIDKIDWNSEVDPDLILDLECDSVVPDSSSKDEQVVIFGTSFPPSYHNFSPYGWGDSDDGKKKDPNTWGDSDDDKKKDPNTSPESNEHQQGIKGNESGLDKNRNNNWGWNAYENNNYSRYKTSRFRRDDDQRLKNNGNNGNRRKSSGHGPWKSAYSCSPGGAAVRWSVKKPIS